MTFQFIFFTITIKKRAYTASELEQFQREQEYKEQLETIRSHYHRLPY
ncbi:YrzI family small protein [Shouchella shacheensis]|nr:YrzI family small protein [Shouchella shacheensis]